MEIKMMRNKTRWNYPILDPSFHCNITYRSADNYSSPNKHVDTTFSDNICFN